MTRFQQLLARIEGRLSPKKLRLLLCAFYRKFPTFLSSPVYWAAIEAAEKYVEGEIDQTELDNTYVQARKLHWRSAIWTADSSRLDRLLWSRQYLAQVAAAPDERIIRLVTKNETTEWCFDVATEEEDYLCSLVCELFGVTSATPECISDISNTPSWLTPGVVNLAQAAYEYRETPSGHLSHSRMTVLADALEDAGCIDQLVLTHLRDPRPHVRGCWVIDLMRSGKDNKEKLDSGETKKGEGSGRDGPCGLLP